MTPTERVVLAWTILALAALGDVLSTHIGLVAGLAESNTYAVPVVAGGLAPMLATKLAIAGLAGVCWIAATQTDLARPAAIPVVVALPWLLATVWNSALIALTLN